MTSILALAVVGSWTYAGFLAEPKPASPKPPAVVVPTEPEGKKPPVLKPELKAPQPSAKVLTAPPASAPLRYRLADASGQHWEHSDPVFLWHFVYARNRAFVAPSVPSTRPVCGSRPGPCP